MPGGNFWSLLGVLAMVVLILILAYWATRWIGMHGMPGSAGTLHAGEGGTFCILGQLAVGRNERLVLIRLEQRCFLLGVTERRITLLRELTGEEAEPWLRQAPPAALSMSGFAEVLSESLRKKK